VRKKFDEYDFLQYIVNQQSKKKAVRILDLCCADSFILSYIHNDIEDYIGIDFNEHCINKSKKKWKKFHFEKLDLTKKETFERLLTLKPNFILVHGAIHHLDNEAVKKMIDFIKNYFPDCIFISVDPVKYENKILNKLMILLDRGKFIRSPKLYKEIIGNFNHLITDDFYRMSFKYIFHYNNIDIQHLYNNWKSLIK
tara:strand:- start:1059 stop:1649 length:591 start_codon:yes stop_codon:yes gene_type:complete